MKRLLVISTLLFSSASFAGSHGVYSLSCTSESLRTHLSMQLNDYDFGDEALFPQSIVMSVMGNVSVFDDRTAYQFKTKNKNGMLEIYSTDNDRSHVFEVDFRSRTAAKVVIKKAINPRTWKSFSGLTLSCTKSHSL